jgi:NAD(P)-dependent dehydrogenase (short-subunit alcohol dehydrogenase family)
VTTNLFGTFLCARAVLPHMIGRRRGTIVTLSGGGATAPAPNYTGYACSKAAILRLTDSLAAEAAPHGVHVFALGPGLVRTAMTESLMRDPRIREYNPGFAAGMAGSRAVPPERAGALAVFLATLQDPRLSGRVFGVAGDYASAVAQADEIAGEDRQTLRLRT